MPQINSQTFTFSPPQQDASMFTQPGTVTGVPIDGSSSKTVAFMQPFAQYCNSVVVQYAPTSPTGYVLTPEVTNVSVNGFTLTVNGGPIGASDSFTFQATGT